MDLLLLAITVVSLLIALFLGIAAWGMWREERARSAARVAALTAAASDDAPAAHAPLQPQVSQAPAPRPTPQAAPWSGPADWRRLPKAAPVRVEKPASIDERDIMRDAFLGSAVAAPASGSRQRGLAIAASVLFVAIVAGGYFFIFGERGGSELSAATPAEATATPLELISLRHEREKGALSIAGLVRNPNGGRPVEKLDAVVFLFNSQGEFVTSSRAGVDFTQLQPGDESPFVIRVNAPASVARYRVSFRTDAGVIPHIDRRGQEPIARDMP
jgi:hypothetical protein